jgi:amidohydrolase
MDYYIYQKELINLRRFLHRHPETAFREFKTTAFIKNYLEKIGYKVKSYTPTGCSAFLELDKNYPTVVLRAEIDAVPITERADVDYKSENEGAMHACGHDANIAVVLVLAKMAYEKRDMKCNIRFLFEPAEEQGKGSAEMIRQGVLENPKADYFIMFHFANKETWGLEINHYAASATVGRFDIKVNGNAVHWCIREKGHDALFAGAKVAVMLNDMNDSYKSKNPFCIGVGMLESGTSSNMMAESATLSGGIRTYTVDEYNAIAEKIRENIQKIANETGTEIKADISREPILPIVNDKQMTEKADIVGKEVFKDEFYPIDFLFLAGDNASAYFNYTEGIFMVFRCKHVDERYTLHNSRYIMDDSRLYKAVEMLHKFIKEIR